MTHKVSTGKGGFVFVEVPIDVKKIQFGTTNFEGGGSQKSMFYSCETLNGGPLSWSGGQTLDIPPGSYTFIGTTKDISEEQAGEICDRWDSGKWDDYERHLARVDTATESFRSLLIANKLSPELNYAILKQTNG